jgi:hypothetical protein
LDLSIDIICAIVRNHPNGNFSPYSTTYSKVLLNNPIEQ